MKKLLLSTMLLAGVSFGFAKGTPVKTEKGEENTSNKKIRNMCKAVHYVYQKNAQGEAVLVSRFEYEYFCLEGGGVSVYVWSVN